MSPTPAPARARTLGLVLAGGAVFLSSMGGHFRTPLLPVIGDELSMTAVSLGLIGTAFGLGRLATDLPAGFMSDRFTPQRVFGLSGLMVLLGAIGFALAPVPAWVMLGSFAIGVGSSLANAAGVTYFLTNSSPERRGRAMAGFSGALLIGQAAGPAVSGLVADASGWRTAMWVASGFGVALVAGAAVTERRALRQRGATDASANAAGGESASDRSPDPSTKVEAPPPGMTLAERWALYGVSFAMMFTIAAMPQTLIPIIGGDSLSLSVATIGTALGIGGLGRVVGTFLGGWLTDRFDRKLVLLGGIVVQSLGIALLAIEGSVALWYASIVVMSVSSFGMATASAMIGDRVEPARVGREIGSARFVGDAGVVIGPLLAAYVLGAAGQFSAAMLVTGVVLVSGLALAIFVPSHHGERMSGGGA